MPFDWQPREPDADRARSYVRAGFWNDETLGGILANGLRAVPDHAFTVRSERRPYRGTFGEIDELGVLLPPASRRLQDRARRRIALRAPGTGSRPLATFYAIVHSERSKTG